MVKEYLVGGAVRDKVMHEVLGTPITTSNDIDIAVEATSYNEMRQHIISKGGDIKVESPQFFTIRALVSYKGQRRPVDYTLCRKEGEYNDDRHPDKVEMGTIIEDLARRDLTINAMAIDLETDALIDPYNGLGDIKSRIIRSVGSPETRCDEDALRLLRIFRFSITLGFNIASDTETLLYHPMYIDKVFTSVSDERIREEFSKCFIKNTEKTLEMLYEYPLIRRRMVRLLNLRPVLK